MPAFLLISAMIAAATPPERLAAFEQKLAEQDISAASRIVDDLVLARPKGPLRPDPLLSGLEGRMLLMRAQPQLALAYLVHADAATVPMRQRIAALLALADARERVGDRAGALDAWRRLQALPIGPEEGKRAALGIARNRLADAPEAARAAAAAVATQGGAPAWQAHLIVAEASLLLGEAEAARQAADRAWAEAAEAPGADFAPVRVALVRAALAERAGERERLIAALASAFAGTKALSTGVADSLPVCGTAGLSPGDWVMFAAFSSPRQGPSLAPVAASRIGAAAAFTDALAGTILFADGRVDAPAGGTLFTVRCRTAPTADYHAPARGADPWASWFASRGLFFPLTDGAVADINRLTGETETLARADPDDPRLIPLRLALSGFLRQRAGTVGDVEQWQVSQLDGQVKAGLRRVGGLDGFLFDLWDLSVRIPRTNISRAEALGQIRTAAAAYLATAPLDMAYEATFSLFAPDSGLPVETRRDWLEGLSRRLAARTGDPRRSAVALMLVAAAREQGRAREAARLAGLPDDLCAAAEKEPALADHHIRSDDFPRDVVGLGLQGFTVADFDVGADGKAAGSRILLAVPSGLFDPAMARAVPAFEMKPARSGSTATACRGFVQPVVWKLPDGEARPPRYVEPETPVF